MITMTRLKLSTACLAALAMAACSSGYDYYEDGSAYGSSQSSARYGGGADMGGYDMSGYGMNGYGMTANCAPGMMGAYGGGYTDSGLRGSGRYGTGAGTSSYTAYSGGKSRYGNWEGSAASAGAGCQTGGYWTVPTYQVVQPPAVATPAPVTTYVPEPIVTVQENCPDGQYRMDNGDCAIMMTEETEQYVPPAISYPEVQPAEVDWYNPIRK